MEHWLETSVLPAALAAGVLLVVLWPTGHSGRRLLRTWGIAEPAPGQIREAVRYLRQRRFLYVLLFLVLPTIAGLAGLPGVQIIVPLLVAMLVAELVATLRPVSGVRTASLDRRDWRDLVPRWAVFATAAGAVVTAVVAVVGLVSGPGYAWLALGYAVLAPLVVAALVALAVRRPAVEDAAVDAALRTRTARVAVGIGFGWLGTALTVATGHVRALSMLRFDGAVRPPWLTDGVVEVLSVGEFVVAAVAVGCWLRVAVPGRRSPAEVR